MPPHTATILTIDRAPTRRLIPPTLNDGVTATLTYRQVARFSFWYGTNYGENP